MRVLGLLVLWGAFLRGQTASPVPASATEPPPAAATAGKAPLTSDMPGDGLAEYREAHFEAALPLLRAAVAKTPRDPHLQAALLSSLVYEGKVDEASDAADDDAVKFPDSAPVVAARGEYAFYMADMPAALRLFKQAVALDPKCARADLGLAKILHASCSYRTARLLILEAHQDDPEDALITERWLTYLVGEKRRELYPPFVKAHPWLYPYNAMGHENQSELTEALHGRNAFEPAAEPHEITLKFFNIMRTARSVRGVGLALEIPNRSPLRLLFDTGASGVVLSQRAIDKAGLNHLGSGISYGIGDKGANTTFMAVADTCAIGELKLNACILQALEGKRHIDEDADGLIGADFFSDYLLDIDFQKSTLHLTPLPARPPNPQGYDREIPAGERDFTPIFRFGHSLFVSTTVNSRATGLFLLDTGAAISTIDSTFAKLSTKIARNSNMRVGGLSGAVSEIFEADKATLRFAHFEQENTGLTSFNINNTPAHQEVRMSGILGIPVLSMFHLKIDYRNGLVQFDYLFGSSNNNKKH